MTEGLIGALAGTATSLAIKGVDLLLAAQRGRSEESADDRSRLSTDIWNLLKELRSDYDRLDKELQVEREARKKAEDEVHSLTLQVSGLQKQVRSQETKTDKYKALAEERLGKIRALAQAVTRIQTRMNGLEARQDVPSAAASEDLLDESLFDLGEAAPADGEQRDNDDHE